MKLSERVGGAVAAKPHLIVWEGLYGCGLLQVVFYTDVGGEAVSLKAKPQQHLNKKKTKKRKGGKW